MAFPCRTGIPTAKGSTPPAQVLRLRLIKRLMDQGHRPGRLMATSVDELEALAASYRGTQGRRCRCRLGRTGQAARAHPAARGRRLPAGDAAAARPPGSAPVCPGHRRAADRAGRLGLGAGPAAGVRGASVHRADCTRSSPSHCGGAGRKRAQGAAHHAAEGAARDGAADARGRAFAGGRALHSARARKCRCSRSSTPSPRTRSMSSRFRSRLPFPRGRFPRFWSNCARRCPAEPSCGPVARACTSWPRRKVWCA